MPEANHICKNPACEKVYYCCESCEKINSWKAIACSPECFQEFMKLVLTQEDK